MSEKKEKTQQWWQTLPGMMTALGAVITALTGLLLALNQVGLLGVQAQATPQSRKEKTQIAVPTEAAFVPPTFTRRPATKATPTPVAEEPAQEPATVAEPVTQPTEPAEATAPPVPPRPTTSLRPPGGPLQYPVALEAGTEVKVGKQVYKILAAELDQHGTDQLALRMTIRVINNDIYSINFWDGSARLIVDGVPLAPKEAPNEVAGAQDSKQGEFLFYFPGNFDTLELQLGLVGQETNKITLDLKAAKPAAPTPTEPASAGAAGEYSVTFPDGPEIKVAQAVYRVTNPQVARQGSDELALRMTIRVINNDVYAINFWDASARLIVDGVPIAPKEAPNEVAGAQDSKQGEFLFYFPGNFTALELQLGLVGQATTTVPVEVRAALPQAGLKVSK
jgi:hypothetical protein